jgi:hypothetical protein
MHTGVCIQNIVILGGTAEGIYLRGCRRSVINSVGIDGCDLNNMELIQSTTISVSSFTSSNSTLNGFMVDSCHAINIDTMSVENNTLVGFCVMGSSKDFVILGSIYTSNGVDGIALDGTTEHVVISDCIISNNADKGIRTANASSVIECQIDCCVIENNGGIGVDFDGNNTIVSGCLIRSNGATGIQAGIASHIINNQILSNGTHGIFVAAGKDRSIITNNNCEGNTNDGIRSNGDDTIIEGNSCQNNSARGIIVVAGATGNIVNSNLAIGNTTNQIVDNGSGTIRSGNIGIDDTSVPTPTPEKTHTETGATYTAGTNSETIILADATAADQTINLPAGSDGDSYFIKKIDSTVNTVTIDPNGASTIDGETTKVITSQHISLKIVSDGNGDWYII